MTERPDGQVTWSDLGIWSGKTCPEHSQATEEKTLRQSSKRSSASRNRKPPILKCLKKAGTPGGDTTMKWEDDGAWCGELTTRNTGECPNAVVVSRLSQILEETPQEKYSLSAKACQGILRRAERRGKDLPETLKAVLLMQSESGGGCDGGGKGALVQEDKSGTLGTGNDQTIFCYGISAYESNAMKSSNPKSGVYVADTSRTLDLNGGNPACNQGGMAVVCAGFKLGNSEQARSIGYAEEQSPTLNAECGGNKPAVVALDMTHACDVIRECGEVAPSLQARMGTGGNQVPLTYQEVTGTLSPGAHAGSYNGQDAYNDMLVVSSEISPTLRARASDPCREDMAAYIASVDCRNFCEGGETNGTLQAKSNGGVSYNLQNTVRTGMIVRRLTPMECERLQGFPDQWTDIGEWRDSKGKLRKPSDSPRYKALGNSIALPFWDFLAKRISAQYLRPVMMGSLFDGIGGFPLVFERHNGKGTARWASEIEEFPIAVTKLRFGEE